MGILTADMKRVVEEQRLGVVATVCPDGTPNLERCTKERSCSTRKEDRE